MSKDFLKFNQNQREDVRKAFGFNNDNDINQAIDIFDEWVQKQNHFVGKDFERTYLEAFLLAAKGSIEKAKSRLDKRCTFSTLMPELFDNIQPDVDFKDLHDCMKHFAMPVPTPDNYRVAIDKLYGEHIEKLDVMQFVRYAILCSEYFLYSDISMGYIFVMDMSSINTASVLMKFNIMTIQKASLVLIDGYGHRVKEIHLINSSKFVESIISVFKQGLSPKVANRIIVHRSCDTLKDYIPVKCLPSDYGGSCGSVLECHAAMTKEMTSSKITEYLRRAENYKTAEAKRLSGKFNEEYLGTPGSFRSLNVD